MKNLFFIFLFCFSAHSQSLYNPRANQKIDLRNQESFTVSFKKTLTSYVYKPNDRLLKKDLKQKIERFMNTTKFNEFRGVGSFSLKIVKRNNSYYVLQQKQPERLLLLD